MSLSALERAGPAASPGPSSISLTLMPARDPLEAAAAAAAVASPGGGVRPESRAGGSTCGGWRPVGGKVEKPEVEDVLP